jgi:hypothetical protein
VDVRRCYSQKANSTAWSCCADVHNVAVAAVPLQIRDKIMHYIPSDDCEPLVVVTGPLKRKRTAGRPRDGRSPPPFSSTQFRFRCSPFRLDTVNQVLRSQWCIQICRTSSGSSPVAKCFGCLCFWVRAGTFLLRSALGIPSTTVGLGKESLLFCPIPAGIMEMTHLPLSHHPHLQTASKAVVAR